MDLSIVIPMFNEAENVESTLDRVEEALVAFHGSYEIVAVNDGSLDNTLDNLNKLAEKNNRLKIVSYSKNIGRGMALRTGFRASRGKIIVSIDVDLSYDPHYINDLLETLRTRLLRCPCVGRRNPLVPAALAESRCPGPPVLG